LRQRHVPQRTCVGCGQVQAKRQLVRVVRTPSGRVVVDPTGKQSGRGAYLCDCRECWEKAINRSALNRALKTEVSAEDREQLLQYCRRFGAQSSTQSAPEAEGETSS